MKKVMTLALAALFVSAVQAVSVLWNTGTETWSGDINLGEAVGSIKVTEVTDADSGLLITDGINISANTAWTAICNITITSFEGTFDTTNNLYPTLFGVASSWRNRNTYDTLRFASNPSGKVEVYGTTSTVSGETTISSTGETTLQLIISYDGNRTLTFIVNGEVWGTSDEIAIGYYSALVVGRQNMGEYNQLLATGATYEAEVYFVSGSDIYTLVPEPTVFALFALGVAGIALKRRA